MTSNPLHDEKQAKPIDLELGSQDLSSQASPDIREAGSFEDPRLGGFQSPIKTPDPLEAHGPETPKEQLRLQLTSAQFLFGATSVQEADPEMQFQASSESPSVEISLDQLCSSPAPETPPAEKEPELILYEEALKRAGGFSAYQVIILLFCAVLSNYGSQFVFPYGYLTNAPATLCRVGDQWETCSREQICADEALEYKFDNSDPNYIHGLFTEMDMTCWSSDQISGMLSNFFIGWSVSTLFIWLPDKLGRVRMLKNFIFPAAAALFTSFLIFNDASTRMVFYALFGFLRIKGNLAYVTAIDHLPAKNRALATVFLYGLEGATVGLTCLWFQFVSRDAFSYLNYVNVIYFLILLTTYFLTMESPKWLITQGRHQEALTSLHHMASINSRFTTVDKEGLANVRIFLTQGELDAFKGGKSSSPETVETEQPKENLIWTLFSKYTSTQSLLIAVTALNLFVYYLNSYAVQRATPSGETKEESSGYFLQGILFSSLDLSGYLLTGYLGASFDSFKCTIALASGSIIVMAAKLVNSAFFASHALNLVLTFSTVLSTSLIYSIAVISHTRIVRADLQLISIESAVAVGALIAQLAPRLAQIDSLDYVLLALYISGLALYKATELVYARKVKREREVEMSVIAALRGKPALVGKFAQRLKEAKGLNKVSPVQ